MRVNLSCSATNCVHNEMGLCSANDIIIVGEKANKTDETSCVTFSRGDIKNAINSMGNINITGTIKQAMNNSEIEMTPNVKCEVETCKYNINNMCTAPAIIVSGNKHGDIEETKCDTFIR
ncbi:DUF1540 domain-containing protein [Hathewaya histolytica]|uniref:DUF1540 domain-containing protein n=1 Tax=Hathewaya histolytica TaxID=1498 RepID=UPI003B673FA1